MISILIIKLFLTFFSGHAYHISVCDMEYDAPSKALQISQRLFLDDLEVTLSKKYDVELNIIQPKSIAQRDSLIKNYILQHIQVIINGVEMKKDYIANEIENDGMWCYIEVTGIEKITSAKIKNTVLFDGFDDQANIIHLQYNGIIKSLKLDKDQPIGLFEY